MYCNNCGKRNPEENIFCEHCGIKFSDENRIQEKKEKKSGSSRSLIWKIPLGLIAFCVLAFVLLFAFSSDFRTSFMNGYNGNTTNTTASNASTPQNSIDNSQSVIDINCDNKEGGSGTIFTESGVVLTNNHVIAGASSCLVTLPDQTTGAIKAIYVAKPYIVPTLSKQYDIAFLFIESAYKDSDGKTWGKYPINFPSYASPKGCDKYTPKLGDSVRIYGYPVTSGGYNLTITDGIISSFDDYNDILTSAKVDNGNSGGLAVNQDGCYLGIPSAVISGNYQNLGVIIPPSIVDDFSNKIIAQFPKTKGNSSNTQGFDVSCLSLKNGQMTGNTSYSSNPTYAASLYNGCSKAVKNVAIVVNFYAGADSNTAPLDTEYVDLGVTYLGSKDSYSINGTINTPADTSGDFYWTAKVYSADPY